MIHKKDFGDNTSISRLNFFKKMALFFITLLSFSLITTKCQNSDTFYARKHKNDGNEPANGNDEDDPSDADNGLVKVYKVMNGDCFQNISKLFELMGGITKYINPTDVVVIKGNGQWHNQGYTHTGCIKAVTDEILGIPGFSGEIIICDNIQSKTPEGNTGFDAVPANRTNNWPDHNWTTLVADYSSQEKPVSIKRWTNETEPFVSYNDVISRSSGIAWVRNYFAFHGKQTYLSYPVFESPLNPGRIIDLKNGVWENGSFTGRNVKTIFMPTLNNHGWGSEDYAGVTSAIKSFFGATEIHNGDDATFTYNAVTYYHIHSNSYTINQAYYAGELAARYMNNFFKPVLFITAAMWSGHDSRTGNATETKTVLACENPVTLDYAACKDVIAPYASFLNPDNDNNTRKQILGCMSGGIGTISSIEYEIVSFDYI